MSEPGKTNLDPIIDRFVRSELSAAEARDLAQASLDSPALFDELTDSAAAKAALTAESVAAPRVVALSRKLWIGAAGLAAALAFVFFATGGFVPRTKGSAARPALKPALASVAQAGQPILLAAGLQSAAPGANASVFRGAEAETRPPRATGSIVSIEDGLATIDLGSVDGLAKGTEVQVFRDPQGTQPLGSLRVDTVFRERSRGPIAGGAGIRIRQPVRVADEVHLNALLEQVESLGRRGDHATARRTAESAVEFADSGKLSSAAKRKANDALATLEYRAGELPAAEKHYQAADGMLDADAQVPAAERCAMWNRLGVVHMLLGKYDAAELVLNQVLAIAPKSAAAYAQASNNLGVLAEVRGDPKRASSFYAAALPASAPEERSLVEANLNRIRSER